MIPGCNALKCDLDIFLDIIQDKVNMDPQTACYDVSNNDVIKRKKNNVF